MQQNSVSIPQYVRVIERLLWAAIVVVTFFAVGWGKYVTEQTGRVPTLVEKIDNIERKLDRILDRIEAHDGPYTAGPKR